MEKLAGTYEEIASNIYLWRDTIDRWGAMSDEEFEQTDIEDKIEILIDFFGPEEDLGKPTHTWEEISKAYQDRLDEYERGQE